MIKAITTDNSMRPRNKRHRLQLVKIFIFIEDILESFINKITKLSAENDELIAENLNKDKKIQKAKEVIYDLEDDIIGYKYSDCDLPHFRLRYAGHEDYGL